LKLGQSVGLLNRKSRRGSTTALIWKLYCDVQTSNNKLITWCVASRLRVDGLKAAAVFRHIGYNLTKHAGSAQLAERQLSLTLTDL